MNRWTINPWTGCQPTRREQTPRLRDSIKPWAVMYFAPDGRVMNHAMDYFWTRRGAERQARWHRESFDPRWTCKVVSNRG